MAIKTDACCTASTAPLYPSYEPNGYPGGGVLERALLLKSRKPGAPHPFVDPATFTQWVRRAQDNATKAVQEEKQKAGR